MKRIEALRAHLNRLRDGYRRRRCVAYGTATAFALATLAALFVLLDLAFHLPFWVCWLFWLAAIGALAAGVWAVWRTLRTPISDDAMAVLVERVLPRAQNRLVNAVQLASLGPAAEQFVDELLAEADDVPVGGVQPRHLFSQKPLKWSLRGLAGAVTLLMVLTALTPPGATRSLLRFALPMAGYPPYTLTRILTVTPGDVTVLRGGSIRVLAEIGGVRPEEVVTIWQKGRGPSEEVEMTPTTDETAKNSTSGRVYECLLKGVFYDCRYRIKAGDAASPWFHVSVTNPPGLDSWKADVTPPEYTGVKPYRLNKQSESMEIPEDSSVTLSGTCTAPLNKVAAVQGSTVLAETNVPDETSFSVTFPMRDGGPVRLHLVGSSGLEADEPLPFAVLVDQPPSVVLPEDVKPRTVAERDAHVPVTFQVTDDYGIARVGLSRLVSSEQAEEVTAIQPPGTPRHFQGRFIIDVASFAPKPGDTLRFRVWAEDNGPARKGDQIRRGWSRAFEIAIPEPQDQDKIKKELARKSRDALAKIIQMQRTNLRETHRLADIAALGKEVKVLDIQNVASVQKSIRDLSAEIMNQHEVLGDLATVLTGLVNHEMADVLVVLDKARRDARRQQAEDLRQAVTIETRILAALTGIPAQLSKEEQHQEKVDLLERLRRIVAGQIQNLKDSKALQKQIQRPPERLEALAGTEDRLANDLVTFTDRCAVMLEQRVEDDFAKQIRTVCALFEKEATYEKMLTAAEALADGDLPTGIQNQDEALKTLLRALDILNKWRVENAKKIAREAAEVVKEIGEKLGEMEQKQAKIVEVTRDLAARGKLDDEVRKKLAEMDEEQKDMAELVEKLAQDLYQFPDLPVCNELNSKMREIYEDVEQAMDSENAPSLEIAVQKEDALLDAIRNTKERVEDVEMWLPDIPDNIAWNMESFDTDEFPDMPLVPLPDELEDIVGDLLDQAQSIAEESQDSTGNNMIADMEMGWAVMDGPMPCFSAKGKSGNMRPNDNEMTGRSGAGREGQSSGELVENHVKGLEGTKTHARRTRDPFQKGQVTEDEDSTLDARATGGGKLGGESETIGMFGKAPRRDLNTAEHGTNPTKLRQETEALYATARLLYLGTGSLGSVARELRGLETTRRDIKAFDSLHRKVLRRLEDTQVELDSGVVLPMPVAGVSTTGGSAMRDVDIGKISEEYRDIVSDYYRSLGNPTNGNR